MVGRRNRRRHRHRRRSFGSHRMMDCHTPHGGLVQAPALKETQYVSESAGAPYFFTIEKRKLL